MSTWTRADLHRTLLGLYTRRGPATLSSKRAAPHLGAMDRRESLKLLLLAAAAAAEADRPIPEEDPVDFDYRQALFIDTETTGLWGVGTIAFMVGVGFFDGDAFIVRQYFLRDHGEEAAMLKMLDELAADRSAIISFNGRTFDLPLLDNRFVMNRMFSGMFDLPHLDLLGSARRLWRRRLGSVALGALERNLLGIRRTEEDVPGMLIPQMYHDYLRTGDGRELARGFYHNEQDILSMVSVGAQVARLVEQPSEVDPPDDLLSLARWQGKRREWQTSETVLQLAIGQEMPLALYQELVEELARLLKRTGRSAEATKYWQQIAVTSRDGVLVGVISLDVVARHLPRFLA